MARAQGSGSAGWMVVVGVLVALHSCSLLASSATFTVGGTQGWTIGPDYATWAAAQTFAIGDVLFFPYTQGAHNVAEVNKADYDACSASNAIATHTEGNTNVTLTTSGAHYFLCSFPGHCSAGMLLAVTVGGNATTPASAPSPTVGTPPPTPSTVPAPAPAPVPPTTPPAPVPSPGSVGTPGAVPVPAPAPAPGSTPPTPSSTPAPAPASSSTPAASPPSPPSASSPPAPSGSTPPSSAPSLSSSTFLAAAVLGMGVAFLAL